MSRQDAPITLKEIQKRLQTPQHVLIHLCEKGVIEPDFQQTSGRGVRREFSRRNLFEFAVAMALRRFDMPVATTAAIIRLIKSFNRAAKKLIEGFELPDYLLDHDVAMSLSLYDGYYLVFSAHPIPGRDQALLLGFDLGKVLSSPSSPVKVERLDEAPKIYDAQLQVDLSRIAQRLFAERIKRYLCLPY